jgi:crotonobetainyl-CoA:carnitine CoA-transferase CaiB-like acyl-CoA transferase
MDLGGRHRGPISRRAAAALQIAPEEIGEQRDPANRQHARAVLARTFKKRTRTQWCELLEGSDACFAPVLSMAEAPEHSHLRERQTFVDVGGVVQPAPAPRFSRSVPTAPTPPAPPDVERALEGWLPPQRIAQLKQDKVLA